MQRETITLAASAMIIGPINPGYLLCWKQHVSAFWHVSGAENWASDLPSPTARLATDEGEKCALGEVRSQKAQPDDHLNDRAG